MPFFSKNENNKENINQEAEKKIDFAQKLSAGDLEGAPSPKGGNFNFLKGFQDRKEGEAVAVTMHPEEPSFAENLAADQEGDNAGEEAKKAPKEKWFSRLLKGRDKDLGRAGGGRKTSSRVLDVNLVKGEIVKFFDWQKGIAIFMISIFASLSLLSLAYWGISWWGTSRQTTESAVYSQNYYSINKEIKSLDSQVSEVLKFKDKLDLVNYLLDRHIYWTNFFSFLEHDTLSNVNFFNFAGDTSGNYSMQATTDNLDAINAQVKKLLANPKIKKASVGAVSIGGEKGKQIVSFALSFELDPSIFLK